MHVLAIKGSGSGSGNGSSQQCGENSAACRMQQQPDDDRRNNNNNNYQQKQRQRQCNNSNKNKSPKQPTTARSTMQGSNEKKKKQNGYTKFIMMTAATSLLLLRLASMSTKWRRRRGRQQRNNAAAAAAATTTTTTIAQQTHNDNCNYYITKNNNFNKINKLMLITCMLLITTRTMTICQSIVVAATPISTAESGGTSASSPLSALLKTGGASYNMPPTQRQLQQQQQQLFAMLSKNRLNGETAAAAATLDQQLAMRQHFFRLNEDSSADKEPAAVDYELDDYAHMPRDLATSALAATLTPISSGPVSLENHGFVADDGGHYEQATKAAAAAAAASVSAKIAGNNNNNNCPKECNCLNVFFDCDKSHLERVPALPNFVQTLHLANNKLNDTTVLDIRNLPELHKLTLKRNQLDVMPIFTGLLSLKQLNLASNRIQRISSEALAALPKLKSLNLTKNQLHSIEANNFVKPNRLAHLILNFNEIATVDASAFAALNELADLELSNNRLYSLPVGVFSNLNKLKKLALNYNHLEINWSTFKGLAALQRLQLKANNIRTLQDGVFHVMRNIETIELDDNGITSLSRQGLFNLTKLHHLSLSNNSISRIELDTWEFTQSLETLDLSHNNISEFKPQHLDCLHRLKQLNLAHNKLQYLQENTFDCVKNLEDLNLRRNRLAWIIEDPTAIPPFKSLRKLRKLDLYGNNLKQISSKSLSGLNNLELLNLGGNALATIQPNAFEHMLRLQKLIFKSLNFICDCELLWFRNWLQSRFANQLQQLKAHVVCGYPEHLLDRELLTLTNSELVCADSPKPSLKQEPANMLTVKGTNITLECIANSPAAASLAAADELKIKWRHDNQHVQEHIGSHDGRSTETKVYHDQSTNQTTIYGYLKLFNVSYESAGRYQCVVSNAFGTTYAQKFKISIGIHPSFLHIPSNLTIDAGETARLVCSATGDPMPEIALQKFGGSDFPAATERRLQVIREENAFLITNAKPSDTGIYTCTADSAAGEIKVNATLLVNDKPQPSIPLVHKEVVLGRTCVLECLSETANIELEQPHREWFKENKPFHISPTTHDVERYYFSASKELLIIVNAQSADAGHYRCEITDNSRTLTLQSELLVVKENISQNVMLMGVIVLTVICVFICSFIIWCTLRYQKRKLQLNQAAERLAARVIAGQSMLSGSRASALDQTQLSTLNRTHLQSPNVLNGVRPTQQQLRPRSLADLGAGDGPTRSRLIVTTTPSFEQRCLEERLTLNYLQQGDLAEQQDHLSSKDSGTGSDAAVKRSLEDFSMALLHAPTTRQQRQQQHNFHHNDDGDDEDDDDDDDDDDNNELQFAPTRALGISQYDDAELYELKNHNAPEHERFLQDNNRNYDGGGGAGGGACAGGGVGVAVGSVLPRKCSAQLSNSSSSNNFINVKQQQSAAVDI